MAKLTAKQQKIYDFILQFTNEHGYPPSVREIGAAVGLKSPSTVHFHMKGLEEAGVIVKAEGKTRAISLPGVSANPVAEEENPLANRVPVVGNVAAGSPIALRVRGESMLNAGILPDDLVVVHRQQDAHNGEIVVALFEDEATVKTLWRKDGHTLLLPENPAYQPIDGDQAEIIGKVVAVVRRY